VQGFDPQERGEDEADPLADLLIGVLGDPAGQFAHQCYLSVTMSLSRNGGREVLRSAQLSGLSVKLNPCR
jgi:hypothetical protein